MTTKIKEYPAGKPFTRTHPGIILRELDLKPAGISVTELAERIGVDRKTVSRVVNGKMGISPKMALLLAAAFNTTPDLWLNMQRSYDLFMAEKEFAKEKRTITPFRPASSFTHPV